MGAHLESGYLLPEKRAPVNVLKDRREDELVVMEGVMGLYGGGGIREEGSSILAKVTQTPIPRCGGCKSAGEMSDPLIAGFTTAIRHI